MDRMGLVMARYGGLYEQRSILLVDQKDTDPIRSSVGPEYHPNLEPHVHSEYGSTIHNIDCSLYGVAKRNY